MPSASRTPAHDAVPADGPVVGTGPGATAPEATAP